jgi:NhaP-type Na+/H+ or K+/H+ antiporter
MNQDQQPQPWWKYNWPVLALVALAVVITTILGLGYLLEWTWTGFETKLAWDWLELLIIPLVLGHVCKLQP